ncbi:ABC transporter substrate-binding protein [Paracoccus aminophilus]|uniref:ABC-type dipeptide transport system, periplasmic component n=1 Tax=Paracoccus aminophilus JCM 7686 TaxID=1367847 RepID=S5Y1Q6_PARAH|nr:ABC transporter substrate-binding protein [Paracoccus aminophilus]AGT11412.1 ABC-type dipeptide transport system, periplasmic component [Paracoccus aminophilus JCM 7686]
MTELTRRSLLAGSVAMTAAGLLLPRGGFAQDAQPKAGGKMTIGMSGAATSDTLDPALYLAGPIIIAMLGVCNTLMEIDHTGKAQPELAESVEPDATATTWTFKIRSDAKFSDGKAVTAKDVIASFNHHRGPDSKSGAKGPLEQIKDIRADGDHTVVFELTSGNADFPTLTADYHYIIMPANEDGTLNWQSGLGTGGYTLVSHEPGVRIVLKRRGDYFKKDRAWFEDVELLAIADTTARQNALMTGQVDVINAPDLATVDLLKRRPGISLVETTGTAHYTMPMRTNVKPFDDNNVRLALKYAIDREEFLQKILRGYGKVANDSPITPANRYYAADLPQHSYDPDKAKYYLKQSGLSSLDVQLHVSDAAFTGAVDSAQLFQQSAKACGINVDVKREPADNYWTNIWLKQPFCMGYWNGRPTEDDMFSLVYAKGAEWNESVWDNEKFNQLLLTARAELDDAKRREMYHEMQALVSEDGGTIIPVFVNYVDAQNNKVAHGPVAGDRFFDGWKIVERWWAA